LFDVIAEGDWSVEGEPRDGVSGAGWFPHARLTPRRAGPRHPERDNPPLVG